MRRLLPKKTTGPSLETYEDDRLIIGSTCGLKKDLNEDRIAVVSNSGTHRVIIADGHWGDEAADIIARFWLEQESIPTSQKEALKLTTILEKQLFDRFGQPDMDPETFRTPEASFLLFEVVENRLRIIAYGDCRLLIAREGKVSYQYTTTPTWLGAFSHVGLRDRLSLVDALYYEEVRLEAGDTVIAFTDGVDECVYEVPTLSPEWIAQQTLTAPKISQQFQVIMDAVHQHGAEDNASLAVYRA